MRQKKAPPLAGLKSYARANRGFSQKRDFHDVAESVQRKRHLERGGKCWTNPFAHLLRACKHKKM